MRVIDESVLAAFESGEIRSFALISVDIGENELRFTDCDIPLAYDGDLYVPRDFSIKNISYSLSKFVDQMTLEIDNLDEELTSTFVAGTPQGSTVIVSVIVLDSDLSIISSAATTLFEGEIGPWGLDEEKISITVTNQFSRWNQKTLTRHSASCRWKAFKGTECTYSGAETWCDRTYSRCVALGNQANFGGFRWLPSIVDKDIWWGSVPK